MTISRDSSGAEVAAAAPVSGCALFRQELASEKAHLSDLKKRAVEARKQLERLEAAEHPNAEEISRVKGMLDRLEQEMDHTQGNIEAIQIDITMFC